MRRSWAVVLLLLSDAAAEPPSAYQCAPGKTVKGVGCDCPAGYVAKRGDENTAICAAAPRPVVAPKPAIQCPSRMIAIAGASYEMGSGSAKHQVKVESFCIDKTEVTVAAYSQCVAMNVCAPAPEAGASGWEALCNGKRTDRQSHPVNCITWDEAVAYCTWAGARLPTEEEWELAARGKDGRKYPWGNKLPTPTLMNGCGTECKTNMKQVANADLTAMFGDDGFAGTAPVGSFPAGASPAGVLDMAGNVSEWTASGSDTSKVTRGASWSHSYADVFESTYPINNSSSSRISYLGFRCAR